MSPVPEVSVVIPTRARPRRLGMLLRSLRAQTLAPERFEVLVVDDGPPGGKTASVVEAGQRESAHELRVIPAAGGRSGPAGARNRGWRSARAPLIAFTDDDCTASPEWLQAGLRVCAGAPGAIVQGSTEPAPDERHREGPFSHTVRITEMGPFFETCNVFYPRDLLERLGGFDAETFSGAAGEDNDLAWRAISRGADCRFAADARVYHAVEVVGPIGKLRLAARWTEAVAPYARFPEMRRRQLHRGIFWKRSHYRLLALALALALPRRRGLGLARLWLALRYLHHLAGRCRAERATPLIAPFLAVHDIVETAAVVRGAVRYRTLVL